MQKFLTDKKTFYSISANSTRWEKEGLFDLENRLKLIPFFDTSVLFQKRMLTKDKVLQTPKLYKRNLKFKL